MTKEEIEAEIEDLKQHIIHLKCRMREDMKILVKYNGQLSVMYNRLKKLKDDGKNTKNVHI